MSPTYQESDKRCEFCGKYDECKPFGPHGELICYSCARRGPKSAKYQMIREEFIEK